MAGTFLEGLNLLSISAILRGDGDGGLGSVPRSVRLRPGLDRRRTDKGRGLRRPRRRRGIFMRFAHSKRAVWEIAFYYSFLFLPSLLPCLMQIRTTYGTRTPCRAARSSTRKFAGKLQSEFCRRATTPLPFSSGTDIRNFMAVSFLPAGVHDRIRWRNARSFNGKNGIR